MKQTLVKQAYIAVPLLELYFFGLQGKQTGVARSLI